MPLIRCKAQHTCKQKQTTSFFGRPVWLVVMCNQEVHDDREVRELLTADNHRSISGNYALTITGQRLKF